MNWFEKLGLSPSSDSNVWMVDWETQVVPSFPYIVVTDRNHKPAIVFVNSISHITVAYTVVIGKYMTEIMMKSEEVISCWESIEEVLEKLEKVSAPLAIISKSPFLET